MKNKSVKAPIALPLDYSFWLALPVLLSLVLMVSSDQVRGALQQMVAGQLKIGLAAPSQQGSGGQDAQKANNAEGSGSGAELVKNNNVGGDAQKLVQAAISKVGSTFMPGTSEGCMLFVRSVFRAAGISAPVTQKPVDGWATGEGYANSMAGEDVGQVIKDINQVQPGDVVFISCTYGGYDCNTITHVGIAVTGGAKGEMVDRPTHDGTVLRRQIDPKLRGSQGQFYGAVRIKNSVGGVIASNPSPAPSPSNSAAGTEIKPASMSAVNIASPQPAELMAEVRFPDGRLCWGLFISPKQALVDSSCQENGTATVALFGQTSPAKLRLAAGVPFRIAIASTEAEYPSLVRGEIVPGARASILRVQDGRWVAAPALITRDTTGAFIVRRNVSDSSTKGGLIVTTDGKWVGVVGDSNSSFLPILPIPSF